MTKTFLQVQKQIEQLQREAEQLRKKESDGVRSRIKEAIAVYGFTADDLGFGKANGQAVTSKKSGKINKSVASVPVSGPKFSDGQGNVWSGRGPRPGWFKAALEAGKTPAELQAR